MPRLRCARRRPRHGQAALPRQQAVGQASAHISYPAKIGQKLQKMPGFLANDDGRILEFGIVLWKIPEIRQDD